MADIIDRGNPLRSFPQRMQDMGDGTYALVVYSVADPGGVSYIWTNNDIRAIPQRYHDNGDGTYARVVVGVNF